MTVGANRWPPMWLDSQINPRSSTLTFLRRSVMRARPCNAQQASRPLWVQTKSNGWLVDTPNGGREPAASSEKSQSAITDTSGMMPWRMRIAPEAVWTTHTFLPATVDTGSRRSGWRTSKIETPVPSARFVNSWPTPGSRRASRMAFLPQGPGCSIKIQQVATGAVPASGSPTSRATLEQSVLTVARQAQKLVWYRVIRCHLFYPGPLVSPPELPMR